MFQFPWSASTYPMYSGMSNCELPQLGFPIRTPPDQSLLTAPRGSFVVRHVLRRLLAPRHPPCALISLTLIFPQENIIRYLSWNHLTNNIYLFTQVAKRCSKTQIRFGIQFSRIKFKDESLNSQN